MNLRERINQFSTRFEKIINNFASDIVYINEQYKVNMAIINLRRAPEECKVRETARKQLKRHKAQFYHSNANQMIKLAFTDEGERCSGNILRPATGETTRCNLIDVCKLAKK